MTQDLTKLAERASRSCEHGIATFLRCHDCEAESCKCGQFDPLDPYYTCENCEAAALRSKADEVTKS